MKVLKAGLIIVALALLLPMVFNLEDDVILNVETFEIGGDYYFNPHLIQGHNQNGQNISAYNLDDGSVVYNSTEIFNVYGPDRFIRHNETIFMINGAKGIETDNLHIYAYDIHDYTITQVLELDDEVANSQRGMLYHHDDSLYFVSISNGEVLIKIHSFPTRRSSDLGRASC